MHPAASVIFFTVSSGAGYGLLAVIGLVLAIAPPADGQLAALIGTSIALALITAGLLSSTLHLGRPERAWRAMQQWRTSWLSREAISAVLTYAPAGALWLCLALDVGSKPLLAVLGLLGAIGALATVYCTGMIYAVLRPVREWHTPWTTPVYMMLSLASGAVIWSGVWFVAGTGAGNGATALLALALVAGAAGSKWGWVRWLHAAPPVATRESAIGLAGRGTARVLDPPHTGTNYLLDEMGYRVGRKHRQRLTGLMWGLGFAAPAALMSGGLVWWPLAVVAAPIMLLGVFAERWLFFATATHTVTLYYR